jgi:formimidoylglutamate deiminase
LASARTPAPAAPLQLWAPRAWLPDGWRDRVLLHAGTDGNWASVETGVEPPAAAVRLAGPALPGLVNAHSHSFQRAFAGMAERRAHDQDDFWSWRDRMYRIALRITPAQQQAVAAQLFLELARGGFTHVCEFHYLHRAPDGSAYPEGALSMAGAIAAAAHAVGIGLTLLPAVYERAGFAQPALRADQCRFQADAETVMELRARHGSAPSASGPGVRVGVALHSLRAATPHAVERLAADTDPGPIHIHVAEQVQEVDDCVDATGMRPIAWLSRHTSLDARWHLVHATHSTPAEINAIAQCGAGVVICPGTEANLGDGVPDLRGWLRAGVPLSLGTDSHVCRSAMEELRLLEYAQRLVRRERCVGADPHGGAPSTAARLWQRLQAGGAAAAGLPAWGLRPGARADLLVVDTASPPLLGVPPEFVLDALAFSSPGRPFRDVLVAGRWLSRNHRSEHGAAIAQRFVQAMTEIWQDA